MRVLIKQEEIKDIVIKLARKITRDYEGKSLVVVTILDGAKVFSEDLLSRIHGVKIQQDTLRAKSYHGDKTSSSGEVSLGELNISVQGRDVLVIEDVVDSGRTITKIRNRLLELGASSVRVVTFLNKPGNRDPQFPFEANYIGKEIPADAFVFGYGMDYPEDENRHLPNICVKD